jgi:hypothetical protein
MSTFGFKSDASGADGFGFLKQFWGGLPNSSVMTPTTDLQELDKRIADLKTVEQWLNLNLNMLRTTIQGIEVQRATLATLQSFGANMGLFNPMSAASSDNSDSLSNAPTSSSDVAAQALAAEQMASVMMSNATNWWGMMQEQFNRVISSGLPKDSQAEPEVGASSVLSSSATSSVASPLVDAAVTSKKRSSDAEKASVSKVSGVSRVSEVSANLFSVHSADSAPKSSLVSQRSKGADQVKKAGKKASKTAKALKG